MKKTIQYQNGRFLYYADFGARDGFPILIQHGMIASIQDEHLFQHLVANGARPISIARPGYGESSPYEMINVAEWGAIVSVLVDQLQLRQFDVFGISSGAPYSYAIGYALPERVRSIFILSGIPALFDEKVQSFWPYPVTKDATVAEMQKLARELWFSNLTAQDLEKDDIKDSMANDCFGPALDLKIRGMDWGFPMADVRSKVYMRHSQTDNLRAAELTASMLPDCQLEVRQNDPHFSQAVLDDFIDTVIVKNGLKPSAAP